VEKVNEEGDRRGKDQKKIVEGKERRGITALTKK
jgi:hypothetical protein